MPKPNDDAVTALLSAKNFLTALPSDAPAPVRQYAVSRVVALGGKPAKRRAALRKPAKPKKFAPAPVARIPAPPPPAPTAPPAPNALEVARAKDVLTRVAQHEADARKAELLVQLRDVRAQLRAARPQLAVLASRVRSLQADGENLSRAISTREERISELYAAKPAVADFLPGDPEVLQWRLALEAKESELAQLRAAGAAMPNLYQLRLEGVELQQRVAALEYAETNILNRLSGVSGKAWGGRLVAGGISTAF